MFDWHQPQQRQQSNTSLTKVVIICGLLCLLVVLLIAGSAYARGLLAERRENITFRQIAENNAQELARRQELLAQSREREASAVADQRELEQQVNALQVPLENCEVPDALVDLWRNARAI